MARNDSLTGATWWKVLVWLLTLLLILPWAVQAAETRRGRVLLLGDSISVGYTSQVRERLNDVADVIRPRLTNGHVENCEGTTKGVRELPRWLAFDGGHWDVIHFNFGLHDLKRVNPRTRLNSTRTSHPRQAEPDAYEHQLREILRMLKGTGAKLIFATTTPVAPGPVDPLRDPEDVERYNGIARRLVEAEGIPVNDLYALAMSRQTQWQRPVNVHFTDKGNDALATQVAAFIRRSLTEVLGAQMPTSAPPAQVVPSFLLLSSDPNLDVTLWAAPPQLRHPTSFDFDPAGRVWVIERAHRAQAPLRPDDGRIVVLEDVDRNGVAERFSVFVQEPALQSSMGIAVLDNRVFVSAGQELIAYTDVNRNQRFDPGVDRREVLLSGLNATKEQQNFCAVRVGPDNRLYWTAGAGGAQFTDRSGKTFRIGSVAHTPSITQGIGQPAAGPGVLPGQRSDDGQVWLGGFAARMNLNGSKVGIIGHNFRQTYGHSITSLGDVFLNDNDEGGAGRVSFLVEGGNSGFCSLDGQHAWEAERRPGQSAAVAARRQEDPGVMPAGDVYEGGIPTGLAFVEDSALGPKYRGLLLSCDPARNTVFGYFPKIRGAGFQLDRFDFLTSNPERPLPNNTKDKTNIISTEFEKLFRPTDVVTAPDGAVYIANSLDSKGSAVGAIYRITPKDFKPRASTLDWATANGALAALRSPAANVRAAAQAALLSQQPKASILAPLFKDENPFVRARAVWLLGQLGGDAEEQLQRMLKSRDPQIRVVAFRAVRRQLETGVPPTAAASSLPALAGRFAADSSPAVRREAALALRDAGWNDSKDALLALAKGFDGKDRWYLEALGIGAAGKEREFYDLLLPVLGHTEPLQWNARFSGLAWRLHPPQSVSAFEKRALGPTLPERERRAALTALAYIGSRPAVQALLEIAVRADGPIKAEALWWLLSRKDNVWKEYALEAELKRRQLN